MILQYRRDHWWHLDHDDIFADDRLKWRIVCGKWSILTIVMRTMRDGINGITSSNKAWTMAVFYWARPWDAIMDQAWSQRGLYLQNMWGNVENGAYESITGLIPDWLSLQLWMGETIVVRLNKSPQTTLSFGGYGLWCFVCVLMWERDNEAYVMPQLLSLTCQWIICSNSSNVLQRLPSLGHCFEASIITLALYLDAHCFHFGSFRELFSGRGLLCPSHFKTTPPSGNSVI